MNALFWLGSFLLFSFSAAENAHEFHVSKTEIDYNGDEDALQITLHIFLDDLELSMQKQGADKQFLCTEKELPGADSVYLAYLKNNFQIEINGGQVADYQWVGKEISADLAAVWTYIEIPNVTDLTDISVKNSIILDIHDDQKNIVQIRGAAGSGYFMLRKEAETQKVEF